jgi:hypothetical protein
VTAAQRLLPLKHNNVNRSEPASWRDHTDEGCELCQVLYRDDGAPLGYVLRLVGGEATDAYTTTGVLRRLGACPTDDAARRAVEHAVGTEEGGACW